MYHYVRPPVDAPPFGYYHLALSDFREQLDYFEATYTIPDRETALEALSGSRSLPEDSLILTFDDGLRDHVEWVLPELTKRGLWGMFFVPAGPYLHNQVLDVHRVHTLLGRFDSDRLVDVLGDILDASLDRPLTRSDSGSLYGNRDEVDTISRFKQLINDELSRTERDDVLTALEHRVFESHPVDPAEVYMSQGDLQTLVDEGMLLGGHSASHRILARLDESEQRREIERSFDFLTRTVGDQPLRTFAYPYGTDTTYSSETLTCLEEAGCEVAFTTVSNAITPSDIAQRNLRLPRRDCTEFKHGDSTADFPPS
ncbi:polysaccharide deacetylase family protein [Natrialbaceae archaeon A-CW1-1]